MDPAILRFDPATEFHTVERCYIVETSNGPNDEALSIARVRVPVGVCTAWHRLRGTAERYVIVSGRGRMELEGLSPREVGPGDVVLIPSSCAQRILNLGESDLLFLAICTPPFKPDVYEDIEDHPPLE